MFGQLNHIGIAVADITEALELYENVFGLKAESIETVEDQGVQVAMLAPGGPGGTRIELLAPVDEDGPVARFIEARGPGLHHMAFTVADIEGALAAAENAGLQLIDKKPRIGAGGALIAFIHPRSTMGTLVELCQPVD